MISIITEKLLNKESQEDCLEPRGPFEAPLQTLLSKSVENYQAGLENEMLNS